MSWNYRIVKRTTTGPESLGSHDNVTYGIHEVYYDEAGDPWGVTENPVELSAEYLNELKIEWVMLLEAFSLPILDYDDITSDESAAKAPYFPQTDEEWEELETRPFEELTEELGLEPFDPDAYAREVAATQEKEELQHEAEFVSRSPEHICILIAALRSQSP